MRKSDKKTENAIIAVLTEVCEAAKDSHPGFQWLTHTVNYNNFPESLKVICVFDSSEHLAQADTASLAAQIQQKLASIGIQIKSIHKCVSFTVEAK